MPDPLIELFTCPRMPGGLRLMPESCAKNYRRGKTATAWETAGHCRGCEIGARHAGEAMVFLPPPRANACHTCGTPSPRLVFGLVCVSCFNRLAEAMRGRNARGQVPRKWKPIQAGDCTAVVKGGMVFVGAAGRVRFIARAPRLMVGPEGYWGEVIGEMVELPGSCLQDQGTGYTEGGR